MGEPTSIRVVRPGLLTTVQDLGRIGFQRFGVAPAGAMDPLSFRLANRLVGNPDGAAALEITLQGPELELQAETLIAVTGADLSPGLDGEPLAAWTAVPARRGARLTFGPRRTGARAYLAIAGGVRVPQVLGSRATHLRSRTGGLSGRALAAGDCLPVASSPAQAARMAGRQVPPELRPFPVGEPRLRAVRGPQANCFPAWAFEILGSGTYRVSPESDRMGYRLAGPALPLVRADIISDATPAGSVQVPASGQPILLMADRQPTGGYAKIAVVATADLGLAGQLAPGDPVRFELIGVTEAQAAWRQRWEALGRALAPVG